MMTRRETWQAAFDATLGRTDDPFLANRDADAAVEALMRTIPVEVEMHAFFGGAIRLVDVPADEWPLSSTEAALELIFKYGQNDFQPKPFPSVSVGDVVRFVECDCGGQLMGGSVTHLLGRRQGRISGKSQGLCAESKRQDH